MTVTSPDYDLILDAMNDTTSPASQALTGIYTGDPSDPSLAKPRKFLAYVLGDGNDTGTGDPLEVVLAYQYDGHHTDTSNNAAKKNWRCFQVGHFVGPTGSKLAKIDFAPSTPITPPAPLNNKQVKRQNCVLAGINQVLPKRRTYDYHAAPPHP